MLTDYSLTFLFKLRNSCLDEPTNNIDFNTKETIIQALVQFGGALIVVSHDLDFLDKLKLDVRYVLKKQRMEKEVLSV